MNNKKNITAECKKIASELGRRGGLAIVRKRGKKYMKKIGIAGAKARWGSR